MEVASRVPEAEVRIVSAAEVGEAAAFLTLLLVLESSHFCPTTQTLPVPSAALCYLPSQHSSLDIVVETLLSETIVGAAARVV
jgi:hypothetical protein